MGHGDEVVLAAGTADDAAVLELIAGDGAQQGRHHRSIDEPGVAALLALRRCIAGERVGEGDAGHGDAVERLARQLAQLAIERLVADEKSGMQDGLAATGCAHAAAQDAGPQQRQEPVHQHLGAAVESYPERRQLHTGRQRNPELVEEQPEIAIARVAQDQSMCQRIRERADADLQRAAVPDKRRRVERHGVVGQRYRLLGRRK